MADRYQDRPFLADDDYDRDDHHAPKKGHSDPLAELARLIGQTDPLSDFGRGSQPAPVQDSARFHSSEPADEAAEDVADDIAPAPPSWMQSLAARQNAPGQNLPGQDFASMPHPVLRRAAVYPPSEPNDQHPETDSYQQPDSSHRPPDSRRYDDALFGQAEPAQDGEHDGQQPPDGHYQDGHYAYQDGYDETENPPQKRRGGMMTVAVVLVLAVVGTGAAFAYRTYVGSPRSGEPPVIKADTGPNKIVPQQQAGSGDAVGKLIQDRMAPGSGSEQMLSREEQPVDVKDSTKSGARVVFPPLNQNANPPSTASVAPNARVPANPAANGTLSGDEPRKIKTLAVRGDPADASTTPVARQAASSQAATKRNPPPAPVAAVPSANAPMSLSPQAANANDDVRTRVASTNPAPQIAASNASVAPTFVVQISSQRNEADANASFKALQVKFPAVLGSRSPLIKRADLGEKGVYYRAMVGPFGTPDEASQFCGSLKSAGGQCVVQRN